MFIRTGLLRWGGHHSPGTNHHDINKLFLDLCTVVCIIVGVHLRLSEDLDTVVIWRVIRILSWQSAVGRSPAGCLSILQPPPVDWLTPAWQPAAMTHCYSTDTDTPPAINHHVMTTCTILGTHTMIPTHNTKRLSTVGGREYYQRGIIVLASRVCGCHPVSISWLRPYYRLLLTPLHA